MKTICLIFLALLINLKFYSIMAQEIENATLLKISKVGTTYYIKDYPIFYYPASRDYKTVEYFEFKDTLFRDTLVLLNNKYTIDSIFFKESNYSGSFDLYEAYFYKYRRKEFVILSFVNLYQMGTDQQVYYIIFLIENNQVMIKSIYVTNNHYPSINVRVIKRYNKIKLKSKNLDEFNSSVLAPEN